MSETKVVTGMVRFSYAHVFEAKAMSSGSNPKYSVLLLIPKADKQKVALIKQAIENAKKVGESKLANKNGQIPKTLKTPLRDGDEERPGDEVYEGHYFMNAASVNRPEVVDESIRPILSRDEFYSGCYGRASLNFYAFNTDGNRGIACGLNSLQKLKDGEKLGGGSSAASDFGNEPIEVDDDDDLM